MEQHYKYYPYLDNFRSYFYSSSHGVGDGTYYPSDPQSMPLNFFRILENDTDIGYLYFLKTNGIFTLSYYMGYHVWDAVGSCHSSWWNKLFAVGSDASFDYPY